MASGRYPGVFLLQKIKEEENGKQKRNAENVKRTVKGDCP